MSTGPEDTKAPEEHTVSKASATAHGVAGSSITLGPELSSGDAAYPSSDLIGLESAFARLGIATPETRESEDEKEPTRPDNTHPAEATPSGSGAKPASTTTLFGATLDEAMGRAPSAARPMSERHGTASISTLHAAPECGAHFATSTSTVCVLPIPREPAYLGTGFPTHPEFSGAGAPALPDSIHPTET